MADDVAPTRGDDAAQRGRTTIADKVLETLAARTALDVPGVVPHSTGPQALARLTSSLPSASVESAGGRVRIEMDLAVSWESEARHVAGRVRDLVRSRLTESTGTVVDRVDVTVTRLVQPSSLTPTRRVE